MSIDTVLHQLGFPRHDPNSLEAQLRAMRRDVQRLGQALSKQVTQGADDWNDHLGDFSRDAMRQATHLAEMAGSQALKSAEIVRRDPLPLVVVIGTGLLLARLLQRR